MSNTKKAHPHAEFLRAIADGDSVDDWVATINHNGAIYTPTYFSDDILHGDLGFTMSRKPRTININGIEVHEPLREAPEIGAKICRAAPEIRSGVQKMTWQGVDYQWQWLRSNLLHLDDERCAAELHARALLSFTEVSDGE